MKNFQIPLGRLTQREKECLYLAGRDKNAKETAKILSLSVETVYTHRKTILQKLHCRSITGALMIAFKQGLLSDIKRDIRSKKF